jgi:hypothetical protein
MKRGARASLTLDDKGEDATRALVDKAEYAKSELAGEIVHAGCNYRSMEMLSTVVSVSP